MGRIKIFKPSSICYVTKEILVINYLIIVKNEETSYENKISCLYI